MVDFNKLMEERRMAKKEKDESKPIEAEDMTDEQLNDVNNQITDGKKTFFDFSKDDGLSDLPETIKWNEKIVGFTIEGKITQIKEREARDRNKTQNIYIIQKHKSDELYSIWDTTVLKTKFQELNVQKGSFIGIQYLGKAPGLDYYDFKVFKA